MIGCPDPDLLEDVITMRTLKRWEQYEKQAGFRDDIHWGMLLSLLANVNRGKDDPPFKPAEFMPYLEEELPDSDELEKSIKRNLKERLKLIHDRTNP